jgi:murein DD-endopeptidase MepM/ murein hydrolase activator NlpD
MRKNLAISALICLAFWLKSTTVESYTKKAVKVDNNHFHTYQDRQGKWVIPAEMYKSVDAYLKEIETSEEDFRTINQLKAKDAIPMRRPLFFPFSDNYTKALLSQGKGRDIIVSDYRDFVWPVGTVNAHISSKLGFRKMGMHTGIDIVCPNRSPILAAADGVITLANYSGNYGLVVVIQHDINQLQTTYAHNSVLLVKDGDRVSKGQIIAFSGSTGHSTGPHLHFEVRYQNIVLNPEHYIQAPGSVTSESDVVVKEGNL